MFVDAWNRWRCSNNGERLSRTGFDLTFGFELKTMSKRLRKSVLYQNWIEGNRTNISWLIEILAHVPVLERSQSQTGRKPGCLKPEVALCNISWMFIAFEGILDVPPVSWFAVFCLGTVAWWMPKSTSRFISVVLDICLPYSGFRVSVILCIADCLLLIWTNRTLGLTGELVECCGNGWSNNF
jgi:hypothetical protein